MIEKLKANAGWIKQLAKGATSLLHRNSPAVLTGMTVVGSVTTTALAIQVTPRAKALLDELKDANGRLTWREYAAIIKDFYLPTIGSQVLTIVCAVASNRISSKRLAAVAAAHSLLEGAISAQQKQIVEQFGESAAQKITEAVDLAHLENAPIVEDEIAATGNGDTLFYEPISGRYFRSDVNEVRSVQNELNYRLLNDQFIPLNDLYEILDMELLHEIVGDALGWNIKRGQVEFRFTAGLAANDEPCIVLGYDVYPEYDYQRIW